MSNSTEISQTFNLSLKRRYKNIICALTLTETGLSWSVPEKSRCPSSLLAKQVLKSETKTDDNVSTFTVHYASFRKTGNFFIATKDTIIFYGSNEDCVSCHRHIENLIASLEPKRPKRILIFINPGSGWSKSKQIYKKTVLPLIEFMDIATDVIITEHINHPNDVLSNYDLSSIDAIAVVGGDGTVAHVCSSLLKRIQRDSGVDIDDIEVDHQPCLIPISIIPAGTGNGIALAVNLSYSVESAVICMILGHQKKMDIVSLHNLDGSFIHYSVVEFGYGIFGSLFEKTERYRRYGKLRYILLLLGVFLPPREFDCEIHYKTKYDDKSDDDKVFSGSVVGVQCYQQMPFYSDCHVSSAGNILLTWLKPCSFLERLNFFSILMTFASIKDLPFVGWADVSRSRVQSSGEWSKTEFAKMIDWDGEFVKLNDAGFETRVHRSLLNIISMDMLLISDIL